MIDGRRIEEEGASVQSEEGMVEKGRQGTAIDGAAGSRDARIDE